VLRQNVFLVTSHEFSTKMARPVSVEWRGCPLLLATTNSGGGALYGSVSAHSAKRCARIVSAETTRGTNERAG
jgi:hypothetical protein